MSISRRIASAAAAAALLAFSQHGIAQMEGVYVSQGTDECRLTITEMQDPSPQFGDRYFRLESRGVAACMWDGAGISTSTNLAGAYVSLPPTDNRVFFTLRWLFGPASPTIEMVQRNSDGEVILERTYARQ